MLMLLCLLWLIPPAESATPQILVTGQAGLALPDGEGGWTVHVVTSGGLSGNVSQDFTVASDGKIECVIPQTPCPKQPDVTKLQSLIETLPEQSVLITQPAPPNVLCNDCLTRTIIIRRRDSTGLVKSYSAQWNDVTRTGVLPQMLQIYDAAIALQRVNAR
jgi:hypothetical protein